MSTKALCAWLRTHLGAAVVGILLAVSIPSVALAANTAAFSSAYPKPGSISTVGTPMLRITIYDKYGIANSTACTMTIDGQRIVPTLTYIVTGSFNPLKPDHRRAALTYKVPVALGAGWHTIAVRVSDVKGKISTYSWRIGIDTSAAAASFSNLTPAIASSSQVAKPRLAVTVSDRWDVKGSTSYSMKLDGVKVPASIGYTTRGDYRNFTLSYQVATTLTPAAHMVAVSVRDAAGRTTSASWSFTVLQPDPVFELMPAGGTCTDCHVGFPAAHPMTNCVGCHGPSSPPRPPLSIYGAGTPMEQYTAGSQTSPHTEGCSTSFTAHCHGGPFPHVLDSNCTRCHNQLYQAMPQVHTVDPLQLTISHESTATFCTQTFCHATTLTQEHYRYTDQSGAKLDCVTCHGSSDPQVVATIASGSADCASCHGTPTFTHPNTSTAHAVTGDALTACMGSGCHQTDLSHTHGGQCEFCHGSDASQVVKNAVASHDTRCATCHGVIAHTAMHDLPSPRTDSCDGSGCHAGTNLTSLQINGAVSDKHSTCATCHSSTVQAVKDAIAGHNKNCSACHGAGLPPTHSGHVTTVTADVITINGVGYGTHDCSDCHADDLQAIPQHPTCSACHPIPASSAGKGDFTCSQVGCHGPGVLSGNAIVQHSNVSAAHDTTPGVVTRCGGAGCHGNVIDVAAIHNALGRADRGCGICHDGTIVASPTLECATSGCHAGYPVKPPTHQSHIATVTAGVISINGHGYGSFACTTCHGNTTGRASIDLQRISGHSSCASCHPGPAAAAAKDDFTCDQATCHGSGPRVGSAIVQHSAIDAAHDTSAGVTVNCGGAGCHNDVSDLALIHDQVPNRTDHGCGICHDGTIVPTPTANCAAAAGCHPTYPVRLPSHTSHVATVTADDFTINGHDYGTFTCVACHGNSGTGNNVIDAQKISGHVACASCHPTPAGTAGKNDFTCNQPDCHGTGTLHASALVQHAAIDASHNTTTGVATNCGGAGCHTDVSDVAVIHDTVPGRTDHGCGICHDGTLVSAPTKNCGGAAGCHPGYPVKPASHTSHIAPVTASTLTVNGVTYGPFACAYCHGNAGAGDTAIDLQLVPQHPQCATCHPTPAQGAIKFNFTCDQASCHGSGPRSGTAKAQHYRISGIHNVAAAGTNCGGAGCHAGIDVAAIHATVPGRTDSGCGICHDGTIVSAPTTDCAGAAGCHPTYPAKPVSHQSHVATVTASVMTIHGTDYGTHACTECHGNSGTGNSAIDLQKVSGHTACASCHPSPAGSANPGDFTCGQPNCHGAGTLAGAALLQHTNISSAHDATSGATANCVSSACHTYGTDAAAIHNHVPGRSDHGCGICHDGTIVASPTLNCVAAAGCHLNGPPASHGAAAHTATVTTGTITLTGIAPAVYTCSDCHTSLDLQSIHGGPTGCTNCHPDPANSIGHNNWTGSCTQGGCHTASNPPMQIMHANVDASHTLDTTNCAGPGGPCHSMNVAVIHNTPTSAHPVPKGCAACHGRTTAPFAPTKDCLTTGCHSGTSGSGGGTFPAGHPAPASLHTVINGCTQGAGGGGADCHANDVSVIHATATRDYAAKGCSACHGNPNHGPSLTCTDCHDGVSVHDSYHSDCNDCHSNEHGWGPYIPGSASNCYDCHKQGGTWVHNNDGCHCGGLPTYYGVW